MVYVSIASKNGVHVINQAGLVYVRMLANSLNNKGLSQWIGRDADFCKNRQAADEGIRHCHIKLIGLESPWPHSLRQYSRTSDNFLIYAKHWQYSQHCQVLGIITPDAHASIDKLLPAFSSFVAEKFSCLNEHELRQLPSVSS